MGDHDDPNAEWWSSIDTHNQVEKEFSDAAKAQGREESRQGRLAILNISQGPASDMKEGGNIDGLIFENPDDLADLLKNHKSLSIFAEQLLILEDLGSLWVEILAAAFQIPILVFALHWADPADHVLGRARLPLGQDIDEYHILNYREILPFRSPGTSQESGTTFYLNTNAKRPITKKLRPPRLCGPSFKSNATCEQLVSYFSSPDHKMALLLVDTIPDNHRKAVYYEKPARVITAQRNDSEPATEAPECRQLSTDTSTRPAGVIAAQPNDSEPANEPPTGRRTIRYVECGQLFAPRRLKLHLQRGPVKGPNGPPSTEQGAWMSLQDLVAKTEKHYKDVVDALKKRFPTIKFNETTKVLVRSRVDNLSPTESQVPRDPPPLFEELIRHNYREVPTGGLAAASYCRRLLLSRTAVVVDVAMSDAVALTMAASRSLEKITDFGFDNFEKKAWSDEWRGKYFTYLWDLREDLDLLAVRMDRNFKVIQQITARLKGRSNPYPNNLENKKIMDEYTQQLKNDLQEWLWLKDNRKYAFQLLARTIDSYVQTVQARAATISNTIAKNSEKLAGLAAVFVPASLCAAVLAIPSFGAADNNTRFWVFWIFSVPVAIVLGLWLLSPLPTWVRTKLNIQQSSKRRIDDLSEAAQRQGQQSETTHLELSRVLRSARARYRDKFVKNISETV